MSRVARFWAVGWVLACLHLGMAAEVERSVVMITCTSQTWLFDTPWQKAGPQQGSGTGFIVRLKDGRKRILTNAHVVSDARYLEVMRLEDDRKHIAKVEYIAHDCDLALLTVDDPGFFEEMVELEFGELPELDSVVTTYGFPIGGDQLSVTRGVVSRIQQWTYAHSEADAHLVIQTDAAINPGNSGGPVLKDGKVVGVAFQGIAVMAENIGYMIPTLVVEHFIEDAEDGKIDGFGEIGLQYRQDLQNPMVREILRVPAGASGVVVTRVFPNMPAFGKVHPLDVLMEIDGHNIGDNGFVKLNGREIDFPEVMERLHIGMEVNFKVWRDGGEMKLKLPIQLWKMVIPSANPYDVTPRYIIFSGLCFTPLSKGYMQTLGGMDNAPLSVRQLFSEAMSDEELVSYKDFPVLSTRLPDISNRGCENYVGFVVDKIGGVAIKSLADMKRQLYEDKDPFITIDFRGHDIPLVLKRKDSLERHVEILRQYHIPQGERL